MKSFFKSILIVFFFNAFFVGCYFQSTALYSSANSDTWLEYELPPSKILNNGHSFFNGQLGNDNSSFFVYDDDALDKDKQYYYNSMMQDWGWYSDGDKWKSNLTNAKRGKLGNIYVNPRKRIAVYLTPEGKFNVYKVDIVVPKKVY